MTDITEFPIPTKVFDPADYPEFVGDVSSPDDSVATIVTLTQAEYDALDPKVADRLYLIVD